MTFIDALSLALLVLFGAPLPPSEPVDAPKPECQAPNRCESDANEVDNRGEKPTNPDEEQPPPPLSAILKAEFTKRISNGF